MGCNTQELETVEACLVARLPVDPIDPDLGC